MLKSLLIVTVLVICAQMMLVAAGKKKSARTQAPNDCTDWTFSQCALRNATATCGKGTKQGTRTGENCPVKEKPFPCKIQCEKKMKKKCKYNKGTWSECNTETNQITKTKTLIKGDAATCQATKVMTKKCPRTQRVSQPARNRGGNRNRGQ